MPNFIGFLRSTQERETQLAPGEGQRALERYIAWSEDLEKQGKLISGGGLSRRGRVVRAVDGELTSTDGPHAEAAEIVGGYIVIVANDLDEAEKLFGTHPHLEYGPIEVRKVGERGCED
ncbi:YciI family protein [Amycolatopsis sp. NPDC059657]|uniref:YciI family protein n=1 Tax=Amycolatopsis sp. NPDC059657 TaxID=3346899 RepID=UPI00366A7886